MAAGLTLGFVGMAGSALGFFGPGPVAQLINTGEHASLVVIGAGMLLRGISALRVGALGRWSALPLPMSGLLSLTGIVFLLPAALTAIETGLVPQVFAACWILIGYAGLNSRRDAPTPQG